MSSFNRAFSSQSMILVTSPFAQAAPSLGQIVEMSFKDVHAPQQAPPAAVCQRAGVFGSASGLQQDLMRAIAERSRGVFVCWAVLQEWCIAPW